MTTVRWTIPTASLSEQVLSRMLKWDGTVHKIYATGKDATLSIRQDGDHLIVESQSDSPADYVKSHVRYVVASGLGGKEQIEEP